MATRFVSRCHLKQIENDQGRRSVFLSGGAENERRRREFVRGVWGQFPPPQKILKSRGSEIVFTALSARYFLK